MSRFRFTVGLAAILASGSAGCLLYTDPINVPPTVTISAGPAEVHRGERHTFFAQATDGDGDELRYEWRRGPTCPGEPAAESVPPMWFGPKVEVPVDTLDPFCLWVVVRDRHGARNYDDERVTPVNRRPVARIRVLAPTGAGPHALHSDFRLSGADSKDADPDDDPRLTYRWELTRPGASSAIPAPRCERNTPREACFRGDASGPYEVRLVVSDGLDEGFATERIVVDVDRPPCIRGMTPSLSNAPAGTVIPASTEEPTRFEVTRVEDDGDPFPHPDPARTADANNFTWKYRLADEQGRFTGEFARAADHTLSYFVFPAGFFELGRKIQVRVEYRERGTTRTLACPADQARCELAPECAQWVTWTVEFRR